MKLISEAGVGTVAAGVAKAFADMIHSGNDGGTGASPLEMVAAYLRGWPRMCARYSTPGNRTAPSS